MSKQYKIDDSRVSSFFAEIKDLPYVAVDTETWYNPRNTHAIIRYIKDSRGVLHPNNEPFIMTVSTAPDNGFVIEVNEATLPYIRDFLETPQRKIMANAPFDLIMFKNMGIEPQGEFVDVLVLHNLINEEDVDEETGKYLYGLDALAAKYISPDANKYAIELQQYRRKLASEMGCSMYDVSYKTIYEHNPELMVMYATSDTRNTLALYELWLPQIYLEELDYVYGIEMSIIPIITQIEVTGHAIDLGQVHTAEQELQAELENISQQVYKMAGKEININSSNDIVATYQHLGYDYSKKSEKGNWVTDKLALKALTHHSNKDVSKFSQLILDYRKIYKMLNTFLQELKTYYQPDGKIHAHFWQAGTRTGRFSSSDPNMQNIDKKNTIIRRCFIPSKDYILAYFDYAQQEYRLLAHHANEKGLIDMIEQGYDVHKATAALIFNKPIDQVTDDERAKGKQTNFALVYGLGNAAFANNLGHNIDVATYNAGMRLITGKLGYKPWALPTPGVVEAQLRALGATEFELLQAMYVYEPEVLAAISHAQEVKQTYFAKLPRIKQFIYDTRNECRRNGFVRNWAGRKKRYNNPEREAYKAVNALIQGGCGDILKTKLLDLSTFLAGKRSRIVNLIHDEIVVEIHKTELDIIPEIKELLTVRNFNVTIDCDVQFSTSNWAEKKDFTSVEEVKKCLK